jgi:fructokinase
LGGAPFNFIYHIWKILGKANFISSVGADENGFEMLGHLKEVDFPTHHIKIDKDHPTGIVNVTLDENKSPQFKMSGLNCFDYFQIDDKSRSLVEFETDLLYFGTFGQRNETARQTIQSTFGKGIKYFCDLNLRHEFFTKEMIAESLATSNVVKLNDSELELLKSYFDLPKENSLAIKKLTKEFKVDLISITLGSEGAILFDGKEFDHYKSEQTNVVDTLGAGDAFSAILALGYIYKMKLRDINKLANLFAGEICKIYGAIPTSNEFYRKSKEIFTKS